MRTPRSTEKKEATALAKLVNAVSAVYFAAHWSPDRDCEAERLWTELRDAAGFAPGYSTQVLGPPRK